MVLPNLTGEWNRQAHEMSSLTPRMETLTDSEQNDFKFLDVPFMFIYQLEN